MADKRIAADTARRIRDRFAAHGIRPPAEVQAALDRLDTHDANRPPYPTVQDRLQANLDGDYQRAADLAVQSAAADLAREAWAEARAQLGLQAMAAWTGCGNQLTKRLQKIAGPLIEQLEQAAGLDDVTDLAALIRAGRDADYQLAARLDLIAADLAALFQLRRDVTTDADYGQESHGVHCGVWQDPRLVPALPQRDQGSSRAYYLAGIRGGAGLWFPLPAEAEQQAAKIRADQDRVDAAKPAQVRPIKVA